MTEDCDWVRRSHGGAVDKLAETAFKAGQQTIGLTVAEAAGWDETPEMLKRIKKVRQAAEELAACEARGGKMPSAPAEPAAPSAAPSAAPAAAPSDETKVLLTLPDCAPCDTLLAKAERSTIEVIDCSTEDGEALLEELERQGIHIGGVPETLVEGDKGFRRVTEAEFLGQAPAAKPKAKPTVKPKAAAEGGPKLSKKGKPLTPRQQFMSECLKANQTMKDCNDQWKERKAGA